MILEVLDCACRRTDKVGIWLKDDFRQFSIKTYVVGTH